MAPVRTPRPAPVPAPARPTTVDLETLAVGQEFDLPYSGRRGRKLRESTSSSTLVRLWPPVSDSPDAPTSAPEDTYIGSATAVQPRDRPRD